MKRLPSTRPRAISPKARKNYRWSLTPLRALPKDRLCEDVYPGGFRSSARVSPTAKVIPFPGAMAAGPMEPGAIESAVDHALHEFTAPASLCVMLFFAPPVNYFAAFRSLHPNAAPKEYA